MYFMKNNLCTSGLLLVQTYAIHATTVFYSILEMASFLQESKYSSFLHAPFQCYFYHLNYFFLTLFTGSLNQRLNLLFCF